MSEFFRSNLRWAKEEDFLQHARDFPIPPTPDGTITGNIRFWLDYYHTTRKQLAETMGVQPSQVTRWLNNSDDTLTWGTIKRIAAALPGKTRKPTGGVWPFLLCVPVDDYDNYNSFSIVRLIKRWIRTPEVRYRMIRVLDTVANAPTDFFEGLDPGGSHRVVLNKVLRTQEIEHTIKIHHDYRVVAAAVSGVINAANILDFTESARAVALRYGYGILFDATDADLDMTPEEIRTLEATWPPDSTPVADRPRAAWLIPGNPDHWRPLEALTRAAGHNPAIHQIRRRALAWLRE